MKSLEERFNEKWIPVPESGCWLWVGAQANPKGYGVMTVNQKNILAHHVAYQLHVGPIDPGKQILHSCDVPSCVNPNHLRLGTAKENSQDMVRKRRSCKGIRNSQSKLTESEVKEIRRLLNATPNIHQKNLAKQFGVTPMVITNIKHRRSWTHVV